MELLMNLRVEGCKCTGLQSTYKQLNMPVSDKGCWYKCVGLRYNNQRMQRISIEDTKREKNLKFRFFRSVSFNE